MTNFFRASLKFVRRVPIVVVILALLATPLALLARAMACEAASCTMMCCLPQSSHSQAGAACHCSAKSGKQLPDFGRISLIAPTTPEEFASLDVPDRSRQPLRSLLPSIAQGFESTPFNPPRA
jgi:hypothetical protein